MSVMKRVSQIFKAKVNKALADAEDPRTTYAAAVQAQRENLAKAERALVDVTAALNQLTDQDQQLARQLVRLDLQAQTLDGQRAKLARLRAAAIQSERQALAPQLAQLTTQQQQLEVGVARLRIKVEAFDTHATVQVATYDAATASASAAEIITALSEEGHDLGMAVMRADDKVASAAARSGALSDLMASGALGDPMGMPGDDLDAALTAAAAHTAAAQQVPATPVKALTTTTDNVDDFFTSGTTRPGAAQPTRKPAPDRDPDDDADFFTSGSS